MKIKHALQEYLLEIEVIKYTPKTIRSYRNNLNLFVRYLDEEADVFDTEDLTLATVRQFSAYMVKRGKKGRYVNGLLKTAKSFIQYCYDEGYGGFNQCLQIPCKGSHRHFIQIWVIPQGDVKFGHGLLVHGGNRRIGRDSLVNLLNGFFVVMNCSIPQVSCLTIQDVFGKTVSESLFLWEAHPHFLHQKHPLKRKNRKHIMTLLESRMCFLVSFLRKVGT